MRQTEILEPTRAGIARAAELLAEGALVAIPTETVYGLAADARNPAAVAAIFAAKGRPQHNPLIVHVPNVASAWTIGKPCAEAKALAAAFWPGPLTLVLPLRTEARLAPAVTAGLGTVALRVPRHPVAEALLQASGRVLAAPSANPSGRISPVTAAHVLAGLGGKIAAVIDAGPCPVGVESTIVAFQPLRILRAGGIPAEAIAEVLKQQPIHAFADQGAAQSRPEAPGMFASHYAPRASVRLGVTQPLPGDVWIGFGPNYPGDPGLNLSPSGDLAEAARNLFALLHAADERAGPTGQIAVAPVPEQGLGAAILDRLRRAAAPRA